MCIPPVCCSIVCLDTRMHYMENIEGAYVIVWGSNCHLGSWMANVHQDHPPGQDFPPLTTAPSYRLITVGWPPTYSR